MSQTVVLLESIPHVAKIDLCVPFHDLSIEQIEKPMQVYESTLVLLHLIKKQFCILRYLFHQTNLASHSKEKKGGGVKSVNFIPLCIFL